MLQEVDDMTSMVMQEPPSSPTQMAVFVKKVQTIIRRCIASIGVQPSRRRPRKHVPDWGARGVKRGTRRQPGRGAGGGRPPVLPFPGRHEHVDPGHIEVERGEGSGGGQPTIDPFDSPNIGIPSFSLGLTPPSQSLPSGSGTLQMLPPPGLGFSPFQSPHPTSFGVSGFRAPCPPGEEMRYLWTISPHLAKKGIHIIVEFEHIQQQSIPITHDKNTTTLPEYITAVTQMVSDEPSILYTTVNNDDDEVDGSDGDDAVSSQSELEDDNDPEEGEFQTPLNPINSVKSATENIVPQWESSQWFSNARYDYTHSGTFLDMGSGSPMDDLVESGTVRLLNWNDSITDIQLGMRYIDKVQAISSPSV
ncbi:hypothetical protein M9H77_23803 [Catharanthus roseus]|uniref:Uncharacterized protein n=1 Tax=Catharanthus roseus TaxID=4058 RepID=A0ACC0AUC4_CATRO|nr:hypothetical protein M9H77_23803 [Catharanthus roseus]